MPAALLARRIREVHDESTRRTAGRERRRGRRLPADTRGRDDYGATDVARKRAASFFRTPGGA